MNLTIVGLNHRTAPVELREQVAFSELEIEAALKLLKNEGTVKESLILSTCNRTEVYACTDNGHKVERYIKDFLSHAKGIDFLSNCQYTYTLENLDLINHVFRVSAGLDSMFVGEAQILGQVKSAYEISHKCGNTGTILNKLMDYAIRAGKRVRTETRIGRGSVSVSYAAVELSQKIFKTLENRNVLLIGAGKIGEITAKHLGKKGIRELFIANRTLKKAERIADELLGKAVPIESLSDVLSKVDIVISATESKQYILNESQMNACMQSRNNRAIVLIDIAVPRDFDPNINNIENVFLYNIDDLKTLVDKNLEMRKSEISKAEKLISGEVECFLWWYRSLLVTPIIKSLYDKIEQIRKDEVRKNRERFPQDDWEQLDLLTQSIVRKLLHAPISKLKELNQDGNHCPGQLDAVCELFELES